MPSSDRHVLLRHRSIAPVFCTRLTSFHLELDELVCRKDELSGRREHRVHSRRIDHFVLVSVFDF